MNELEADKLGYCPELREMWSQFGDKIFWLDDDYGVGYVRLGEGNLARVSFWEEGVDYKYRNAELRAGMTESAIAENRLREKYYFGYKVTIFNLRTGDALNFRRDLLYNLDFGGDVYLRKTTWLWYNKAGDLIDINENGIFTDLLKKAGKLMKYIEVWCK